jgi:hypothetical protein
MIPRNHLRRLPPPHVTLSNAPPSAYTLTDTTPFTGEAGPGHFARLWRGNVVRDSADVQFGIHQVGADSLLYWPMMIVSEGKVDLHSSGPALLIKGQPTPMGLAEIPYLVWPYSRAIVVDSTLFYWGVDTRDGGGHLLYASRYDFPRHAFTSVFVTRTDDPDHLPAPRREGAEVVFQLGTTRRTLPLRAPASGPRNP